jgi:HEXXH motif-containing protein
MTTTIDCGTSVARELAPSTQALLSAVAKGFTSTWKRPLCSAARARHLFAIDRLFDLPTGIDKHLLEFVEAGLGHVETSDSILPELSTRALGALRGRDAPVDVLMALTSAGTPGTWTATLEAHRLVFLGGEAVLAQGSVAVTSDGSDCRIEMAGSTTEYRRIVTERGASFWRPEACHRDAGAFDVPLSIYCGEHPLVAASLTGALGLARSPLRQIESDLARALEVLDAAGANIRDWVEWTLRAAVFVDSSAYSTSGTANDWTGLSFFSHPINTDLLALLLVHESAHQGFNLLQSHCPLVDPTCSDLLYSPLKKQPRPLDRFLLALHACKFMLAFMDSLKSTDRWSHYWETQRTEMVENVKDMGESVVKATGLTAAGKLFVRAMDLSCDA